MREARELQTQIEQLERHIAHLDKQLQDVVLAKPKMPTKIIGPNLEEILNAAGFYRGDAVCCNDYEKCIKPCTPKGEWLAKKELAHLEQVDYEKLNAKFGEQAKEYLVAAKKSWEPNQRPVAWLHPDKKVDVIAPTILGWFDKPVPLYTAPPKREWVGLTEHEIWECQKPGLSDDVYKLIEAKLKERNT
jgi:hypothetical protein